MGQIINYSDQDAVKPELQPIGIETIYRESKAALDEKARLYLDMYGKNNLCIKGKAEELELLADADVRRDQIIFKIGYYNSKNINKTVSIDVPFNINVEKEVKQILQSETLSEIVIFAVVILYAIAVNTKNTGLQERTGSLTIESGGEIQRLYEEKIRNQIADV